jgi:hypothetical protein
LTDRDAIEQLSRIDRLALRLRRGSVATSVLATGAVVAATGAVAANVHPPVETLPHVALLLDLVILGGAVLAVAHARRARRAAAARRIEIEAEGALDLPAGMLRAAREMGRAPDGSSPELVGAARAAAAAALAPWSDREIAPRSTLRARRHLAAAATVAGVTLVGAAAGWRGREASPTLDAMLAPWRVFTAPSREPIELAPGDTTVARGDRVTVRVRAPGHAGVVIASQAAGEPVRRFRTDLRGAATEGHVALGPVSAPTAYWAESAAGIETDTFRLRPVDPLLLADLEVEIRPPAWSGRPADTLSPPLPDLEILPGSVLRLRGRANGPLVSAELEAIGDAPAGETDSARRVSLAVRADSISGQFRPMATGSWRWRLAAPDGRAEGRAVPDLTVRLENDAPPVVTVISPGRDLEAGLAAEIPLVVDVRDEGGVRRAAIELHVARTGGGAPMDTAPPAGRRLPLALPEAAPRVLLRGVIRLAELDLGPGDTVVYVATAADANPGHRAGRSRSWRVWIPSGAELRQDVAEATSGMATGADALSERADELARRAEEAGRRIGDTSHGAADTADGTSRSAFGATGEARAVQQAARGLSEDAADAARRLDEVRQGLDASSLDDRALADELERVQELFEEIRASALGEQIQALERALERLDPVSARRALDQISEEASDLRRRLEQTAALLERASTEQAVRAAAERASELAAAQKRARARPVGDFAWSETEGELADRTDRLGSEMDELGDRLRPAGAERAAELTDEAAAATREAAAGLRMAARAEAEADASGPAERAQDGLERAAREARDAVRSLAQTWKVDAERTVSRASRAAAELALAQSELAAGIESGEIDATAAGRQAAVQAGLDRLLTTLAEASRKTALVDPDVGRAATDARSRMEELGLRLSQSGGDRDAATEARRIAESLNQMAAGLGATRRAVAESGSGTGLQEMLERLAAAGRAQAGVNGRSGDLLMLLRSGRPIRDDLAALARDQASIAGDLDRLARAPASRRIAGRPDLLADEAGAIARELEAGRLDASTIARQERLFGRLLDAGRSLERGVDPSRRASRTARTASDAGDGPVSAEAISGSRYPYPRSAQLGTVPVRLRSLVLDYFDRINGAALPDTERER